MVPVSLLIASHSYVCFPPLSSQTSTTLSRSSKLNDVMLPSAFIISHTLPFLSCLKKVFLPRPSSVTISLSPKILYSFLTLSLPSTMSFSGLPLLSYSIIVSVPTGSITFITSPFSLYRNSRLPPFLSTNAVLLSFLL